MDGFNPPPPPRNKLLTFTNLGILAVIVGIVLFVVLYVMPLMDGGSSGSKDETMNDDVGLPNLPDDVTSPGPQVEHSSLAQLEEPMYSSKVNQFYSLQGIGTLGANDLSSGEPFGNVNTSGVSSGFSSKYLYQRGYLQQGSDSDNSSSLAAETLGPMGANALMAVNKNAPPLNDRVYNTNRYVQTAADQLNNTALLSVFAPGAMDNGVTRGKLGTTPPYGGPEAALAGLVAPTV